VDAASEAIAYESGYEGAILEPADVGGAIAGLTGDIRRAPGAALAIASSGLSPSSSLLRELDSEAPFIAAARRVDPEPAEGSATMAIPVGFYGL
jgi:hypothetical protein